MGNIQKSKSDLETKIRNLLLDFEREQHLEIQEVSWGYLSYNKGKILQKTFIIELD